MAGGGGGGGVADCLLRVSASDDARPMAADESPELPAPAALEMREAALDASSTTASTSRFCSTRVPASYTSEMRQAVVQLPSNGSHVVSGVIDFLPREVYVPATVGSASLAR